MNAWEKLKILSGAFAAVVVPVVLLVVGQSYTTALKEREVQAEFVKLAISILQESPTPNDEPIRGWATKVVDRYSGVELGETAAEYLVKYRIFRDAYLLRSEQMDRSARAIESYIGFPPPNCSPVTSLPESISIPDELPSVDREVVLAHYELYKAQCKNMLSYIPSK